MNGRQEFVEPKWLLLLLRSSLILLVSLFLPNQTKPYPVSTRKIKPI